MNIWKVFLKLSDGENKQLELFDAKAYFGGYLKIKRSFFYALAKATNMTKKYYTIKTIEKVKPLLSLLLLVKLCNCPKEKPKPAK